MTPQPNSEPLSPSQTHSYQPETPEKVTAILVKHRRTLDNLNVSVKSTYFPGAWKSYAAKARERTKGKITKVTVKYVYIRWDGWQEPTRAEAAGFFKNDEKGNAVEFAFDECVDGETIVDPEADDEQAADDQDKEGEEQEEEEEEEEEEEFQKN